MLNRVDGSSPHARGTPSLYQKADGEWRFIPACAGNANGHEHP